MRNITGITGDSVEELTTFTRAEAGRQLNPPVSARQIQEYLKIAYLFIPGFSQFKKDEGGLSNAPIKPIHIPVLQKIRELVLEHKSIAKARVEIAKEYSNEA